MASAGALVAFGGGVGVGVAESAAARGSYLIDCLNSDGTPAQIGAMRWLDQDGKQVAVFSRDG